MRLHYGNEFDVYSAGTEATFVKKPAIAVMEELGVDMSQHYSKTIEDLGDLKMDYVVTVCDDAREQCPFHPGKRETIHHSFQIHQEKENNLRSRSMHSASPAIKFRNG